MSVHEGCLIAPTRPALDRGLEPPRQRVVRQVPQRVVEFLVCLRPILPIDSQDRRAERREAPSSSSDKHLGIGRTATKSIRLIYPKWVGGRPFYGRRPWFSIRPLDERASLRIAQHEGHRMGWRLEASDRSALQVDLGFECPIIPVAEKKLAPSRPSTRDYRYLGPLDSQGGIGGEGPSRWRSDRRKPNHGSAGMMGSNNSVVQAGRDGLFLVHPRFASVESQPEGSAMGRPQKDTLSEDWFPSP